MNMNDTKKDPVCGMNVDPNSAAGSSEYEGRTFFFCSHSCLEKFQADPGKYLSKSQTNPLKPAGEVTNESGSETPRESHSSSGDTHEHDDAKHEHHDHAGAGASKADLKSPEGKYTCPMHPEVMSDKPGDCPKCGMSLEPITLAATDIKTIYTCPMHPQIEQDHPGDCPLCGMGLEPKPIAGCAGGL